MKFRSAMALLMKFLIPLAATALTLQQVEPDGVYIGLPVAPGHRPGWLARRDELVVDARSSTTGGMLILQLVLMDAGGYWGSVETRERPRWLRAILATNRHHARVHGHAMVLRWKQTLPLTEWQEKMCHKSGKDREECIKSWERENFCWEKFPFMVPGHQSKQQKKHTSVGRYKVFFWCGSMWMPGRCFALGIYSVPSSISAWAACFFFFFNVTIDNR